MRFGIAVEEDEVVLIVFVAAAARNRLLAAAPVDIDDGAGGDGDDTVWIVVPQIEAEPLLLVARCPGLSKQTPLLLVLVLVGHCCSPPAIPSKHRPPKSTLDGFGFANVVVVVAVAPVVVVAASTNSCW